MASNGAIAIRVAIILMHTKQTLNKNRVSEYCGVDERFG